MSKENAVEFLIAITKSPVLLKHMQKVYEKHYWESNDPKKAVKLIENEIIPIAKAFQFDFTPEELILVNDEIEFSGEKEELDMDDLENVSGGVGGKTVVAFSLAALALAPLIAPSASALGTSSSCGDSRFSSGNMGSIESVESVSYGNGGWVSGKPSSKREGSAENVSGGRFRISSSRAGSAENVSGERSGGGFKISSSGAGSAENASDGRSGGGSRISSSRAGRAENVSDERSGGGFRSSSSGVGSAESVSDERSGGGFRSSSSGVGSAESVSDERSGGGSRSSSSGAGSAENTSGERSGEGSRRGSLLGEMKSALKRTFRLSNADGEPEDFAKESFDELENLVSAQDIKFEMENKKSYIKSERCSSSNERKEGGWFVKSAVITQEYNEFLKDGSFKPVARLQFEVVFKFNKAGHVEVISKDMKFQTLDKSVKLAGLGTLQDKRAGKVKLSTGIKFSNRSNTHRDNFLCNCFSIDSKISEIEFGFNMSCDASGNIYCNK